MTTPTKTYRITNTTSGADLGCYDAPLEHAALDAMARDAGYASYAASCDAIGTSVDDLRVTDVTEAEILSSDGLYQLLNRLRAAGRVSDAVMTDLPTFGGGEPSSTSGVWSWDETHLMVGTCASDMRLVSREDWADERARAEYERRGLSGRLVGDHE